MIPVIPTHSPIDAGLAETWTRESRAATLRNYAIGLGAGGALLLIGGAAMLWAYRQGNSPEQLKEALKNLPPLSVTVKIDPESKVSLAEGGKVEIADGGSVSLAPGGMVTVRGTVKQEGAPNVPSAKPDEDPAIRTEVTVFKTYKWRNGEIVTGWNFPSGSAKRPSGTYCYFREPVGNGSSTTTDFAHNGQIDPEDRTRFASTIDEMFSHCEWFGGGL